MLLILLETLCEEERNGRHGLEKISLGTIWLRVRFAGSTIVTRTRGNSRINSKSGQIFPGLDGEARTGKSDRMSRDCENTAFVWL